MVEKDEIYIQIESACLSVRSGIELLRRCSDVYGFLEKNSVFFSTLVIKALDVGSSSSKSPLIGAKKPAEILLTGNDFINVVSVQVEAP